MIKKSWLGGLLLLLLPLLVMAQSLFDGTWKVDINNAQLPNKPDVFLLQDGIWHCKTCVPAVHVKADGTDQPVSGHPYFNTVSIKVVDDLTIEEIDKRDGKPVITTKVTVSPDGKTATLEFSDSSASNGEPVNGKGESVRVAKGPAGSHAVSGSWRITKLEDMSENGTLVTYKVEGASLTMTSPTGQGYIAKLDGTDAPYNGDPATTSVSVKKIGENTIEERDKRNGQVIEVYRMTVAADGKTMTIAVTDKLHKTSSQFTATKQ